MNQEIHTMPDYPTPARFLPGIALAALLALAPSARAQDAADLAFWQSIQNSTNKAEYEAYLQTFPNGRFAALARARLDNRPGPQQGTQPAAQPEPDQTEYAVKVSPPAGRLGQQFTFTCVNLPTTNSYDRLVVVPAGTPVIDPRRNRDETGVLWSAYTANCDGVQLQGGPFAPGAYEARWMTILFNNDQRYEMKAKTAFSVR